MALSDRKHDQDEGGILDQVLVFGAAILGTVLVVGAIGWYAARHRSDPWTSTDFAQSGALLALGLALLVGAFWYGQRHARPAPSVPEPPISWVSFVFPVVGGIGLIFKGIFGWRDRWVGFHIPFAMILAILAGALLLLSGRFTAQQLTARSAWSRRPSLREALDQLFPAVFIAAIVIPERWSDAAYAVMIVFFILLTATDYWERRRPTGPSI